MEAFVKKLSSLDISSLVATEKVKLCWEVPPAVIPVPNSILMTPEDSYDGLTYKYYATINSVIDT